MSFKKFLLENKSTLVEKWVSRTLEGYPHESREFLKRQGNSFANPVGSIIREGFEEIFKALLDDGNPREALEEVVRLRAVQDFTPSEAVGFLSDLKRIVREEFGKEIRAGGSLADWLEWDSRVDELTSLAFNMYMESRERLFRIRLREASRAKGRMRQSGLETDFREAEGSGRAEG